ncbi:polysaccharide biosynthesis protein [Roseisalinus antarcticus]|uniref:UDP-N-acetyl-alpha-D-glucosamine C6 dehydratase n=1 Tax=Roseisalinus antarcticus TaxID=254357 RepID=A0A1Y5TPX2_9RHOB|nr:nucleoside-diphosphate sugar epimerase/dehydratase [Roseisalinus antarcticus]SLN69275.1 UDP-N-acetyl-alpha-D-glucosamine C6 dehydratase [Roseisalinus antarcticus]
MTLPFRIVSAMGRLQKQLVLLAVDLALIPAAFLLALVIDAEGAGLATLIERPAEIWGLLALMMGLGALFSHLLDLHRIQLKAYEQQAVLRTVIFAVLVGFASALVQPLVFARMLPVTTVAIFTMALTILSVTSRLVMRNVLIDIYRHGSNRKRVLIYGAGQTGVQLATALKTDDTMEPVAFVDDNLTLQKMMVAGLPVHAPVRLEAMVRDLKVDRVVIAMPSLSRPKQAQLARRLQTLACEVRTVPSFSVLLGEGELKDRMQPVDPVSFLGRRGLERDMEGMSELYRAKSVMVSGAGGSIGSELCRQVLACRPDRLVLFEQSELALYQIERELRDLAAPRGKRKGTEVVPVLGSVTDEAVVRRVLAEQGVEIVLHAAAYKHVPMVEQNPLSGLYNNVIGTRTLAAGARDAGVSHFVLISTDKAVRPTNIMGASKRLAELVVQDLATRSGGTRFSMVRFGNVLGSSGSVIPLFEEQIRRGGPVTVTHREVTRYFMTIGEAARLVLTAGTFTEGGDVFVLDMGRPIAILKLARDMIEAAGYSVRDVVNPDGDVEIQVTGLRPGEKLHEELLIGGQMLGTHHPKILRALEGHLSQIEVANALKTLRTAIEEGDAEAARAAVRRWVDGYAPAPEEAPEEADDGSDTGS